MPRKAHNNTGDPGDDSCCRTVSSNRKIRCNHKRKSHKDGVCVAFNYDPMTGVPIPCKCTEFVEPKSRKAAPGERVVRMNLRWDGPHPKVGDFMMSQHRPKYAYRLADIHVTRSGTLEIVAVPVPVKDVPAGSAIHPLRWNERSANKKTVSAGWAG